MGYASIMVKGRNYLTCAVCRQPLTRGYGVCYLVDEPGNTPPAPESKQSLCGPHFRAQYMETYGMKPKGKTPDCLLQVEDIVSFEEELDALQDSQRGAPIDKLMGLGPTLLEQALDSARNGNWAESVMEAYVRMQTEPKFEMEPPITEDGDII